MGEKRNVSGSIAGSTVDVEASTVGGISVGSVVGTGVAVDVDSMVGISVGSAPHAERMKMNTNNIKIYLFINDPD
jgi:hypothetical protein